MKLTKYSESFVIMRVKYRPIRGFLPIELNPNQSAGRNDTSIPHQTVCFNVYNFIIDLITLDGTSAANSTQLD